MKGVFFSADFVKDVNGDLKLLEVNTNTSTDNPSLLDLTGLKQVFVDNNLSVLHIIHTTTYHTKLVEVLKQWAASNNYTVETTPCKPDVLFAPEVAEEANKFILRLTYDEGSVLDSEYTSQDLNTLKLFSSAEDKSKVVPYYHSKNGEEFGTLDSISINPIQFPDYVVKQLTYSDKTVAFYKLGGLTSTGAEKLAALKQIATDTGGYIQPYMANSVNAESNRVASYRYYGIMYINSNGIPEEIELAALRAEALLEVPETLATSLDESAVVTKLNDKHFYEFSTNSIAVKELHGFLPTETMLLDNGTPVNVSALAPTDKLESFTISEAGGVDEANDNTIFLWSKTGPEVTIQSGTTDVIQIANTGTLNNLAYYLEFEDGTDIILGSHNLVLVHKTAENKTLYSSAQLVEPGDKLYQKQGTQLTVTESTYVVLQDHTSILSPDVEIADTFVVSPSNLLLHNSPCFLGFTQISIPEGTKRIDEIRVGDTVKTFNHELNQTQFKTVLSVMEKESEMVVRYEAKGLELDIYATHDHPMYVQGKGYASYSPSKTLEDANMNVAKIEVGDVLVGDGTLHEITAIDELGEPMQVYNLSDVEDNHNFYAGGVLVHNRGVEYLPWPECCKDRNGCDPRELSPPCDDGCFIQGTEITLSNEDVKNIEDIVIGDEVLSYNEQTNKLEPKSVVSKMSPVHTELIHIELEDGSVLTCTGDHPHYLDGNILASFKPELTLKRYSSLGDREITQLSIGFGMKKQSGEVSKIKSIEELFTTPTQTYNISVEGNHNYFANEILTHNKK